MSPAAHMLAAATRQRGGGAKWRLLLARLDPLALDRLDRVHGARGVSICFLV